MGFMDVFLTPGTYDFFLVGGGSGSPQPVGKTSAIWGGSGGGSGGYTFTEKGFVVDRKINFPVIIGGGGGFGGMYGGEQNGSFGGSGIVIVRWNN